MSTSKTKWIVLGVFITVLYTCMIFEVTAWTAGRYMEHRGWINGYRAGYKELADQAVERGLAAWEVVGEPCRKYLRWGQTDSLLPIPTKDKK